MNRPVPTFNREQKLFLQHEVNNGLNAVVAVLGVLKNNGEFRADLVRAVQNRVRETAEIIKNLPVQGEVQPGPEHCGFRFHQHKSNVVRCSHTDNSTYLCMASWCPLKACYFPSTLTPPSPLKGEGTEKKENKQ